MVLFGLEDAQELMAILLQKMRQQVSGIALRISAQRADKDPRRFTDIHITYEISGTDLDEAKVQPQAFSVGGEILFGASLLNANITTS